jgi:hypothetical protein
MDKILYLLFFLTIVASPLFAYIDPGTGSMLFSLVMGLAAVSYFFARNLLIKVKFLFTGKNAAISKRRHSFVIYNEGNQYWNVFRPVLDTFEKRGIAVLYLTSAENDPFFSAAYTHIAGEYIGTGNRAFARLNLLEADIVLMTTPGLEVYQLKRSRAVKHYNSVLLFKDFDNNDSLKTYNDFMTSADVPLFALLGIADNPVNPFTGKDLVAEKENGVYIFTQGFTNTKFYSRTTCLEDNSIFYNVHNSIFDSADWKEIRYKDFKNKR